MRPAARLALHLLLPVMFVVGLIGCLPQLQASQRAQADAMASRCHAPFLRSQAGPEISGTPMMATGSHLTPRILPLSREAQRTAVQIDLFSVPHIDTDNDHPGHEADNLAMVSLRQALSRRIALASSDVMSTIAALDCEAARSDHVADAISEAHQDVSERALFAVFASDIFIGIIPGALMLAGESIAAEASEIFGGVIGTAFGSVDAVLHIDQDFQHPNNFLHELWKARRNLGSFRLPFGAFSTTLRKKILVGLSASDCSPGGRTRGVGRILNVLRVRTVNFISCLVKAGATAKNFFEYGRKFSDSSPQKSSVSGWRPTA
jgi:hypothetical protein